MWRDGGGELRGTFAQAWANQQAAVPPPWGTTIGTVTDVAARGVASLLGALCTVWCIIPTMLPTAEGILLTIAGITGGVVGGLAAAAGDVLAVWCGGAQLVFTTLGHFPRVVGSVLLMVCCLPVVEGVTCHHCRDRFDPPGHAPEACPTITVVAANVTAAAAGTYLLTNLDKVLPDYVLCLFPRAALRALATLRAARNPGVPYTFTKADGAEKDFAQIIQDYQSGLFTKADAMVHYGPMLVATGEGADAKKALAQAAFMVFDKSDTPTPVDTVGVYEGPYRYVLHRVSEYAVNKIATGTTTAWMRVADGEKDSGAGTGSWLKAKAYHPTTYRSFFQMLNLWVQVVHAAGMANCLLVTTFLQDVVYHPMDESGLEWHDVYCLLLVYLRSVERDAGVTLASVYGKGGQDDMKQQATRLHQEIYGDLFVTRGQSTRDLGSSSVNRSTTRKLEWCELTQMYYNASSQIPCKHFNLGSAHPSDGLAADGSCNFLHACHCWTKDPATGKRAGKCLGKHPAGKDGKGCTNPNRA